MQTNNNNQRRVVFTTDAKLAIRRKPAAKMSSDSSGQPITEQANDETVTLEGYAMVWNALSDDRGGFRVRLLPGSANFTPEVHALFHHDFKAVLGATGNSTLRIASDEVGVKVEIDLPNTQTARDVSELVEKHYVRGMSFSMLFDPMPTTATKTEGGIDIEEVSSFTCDEVTVTAIPSFTSTTIEVQAGDDDSTETPDSTDSPNTPTDSAFARVEQALKLDQLALAMKEI